MALSPLSLSPSEQQLTRYLAEQADAGGGTERDRESAERDRERAERGGELRADAGSDDCGCWMAIHYYRGAFGPFQEVV